MIPNLIKVYVYLIIIKINSISLRMKSVYFIFKTMS